MNYLSLILRIVAVLSAAIAAVLYVSLKGKVAEKEAELLTLRTEVQALTDKSESANLEMAELKEELAQSLAVVEEATAKVEATKAEMFTKMQESQLVKSELTVAQRKVSELEATASRLRKELINAENVAAVANQESVIAQLGERVEELTAANSDLRKRIRDIEASAQSIAQVETNESDNGSDVDSLDPRKLTSKQIKAIKEETEIASLSIDNGLIVLEVDRNLNLNPDAVITLIKDPKAFAKVKIMNTKNSLVIANILPGAQLKGVSKGDTVKILR